MIIFSQFNSQSQGHCLCNHGFIGESCSLSTLTDFESNNWFTISSTSSSFSPRIAHSVVYIEKSDTLLSFGGLYGIYVKYKLYVNLKGLGQGILGNSINLF